MTLHVEKDYKFNSEFNMKTSFFFLFFFFFSFFKILALNSISSSKTTSGFLTVLLEVKVMPRHVSNPKSVAFR